jgi:hypothetical protein
VCFFFASLSMRERLHEHCTKHASVTAGCLALQGIEFASVIGDPARSPIGARAIFRPVG